MRWQQNKDSIYNVAARRLVAACMLMDKTCAEPLFKVQGGYITMGETIISKH